MSVFNKLTQLFAKKTPDSEQSVGLSLAMPDDLSGLQPQRPAGAEKATEAHQLQDAPAPAPLDRDDMVSVPLLGRRPIAEQQRLLLEVIRDEIAADSAQAAARRERAARQLPVVWIP